MKHDLQQMISLIALDFQSPAGPIPIERLLRKHHQLLVELRERGLTWEQISRLLAVGGVKRQNGQAFPPSHLRGVFGRHRKRFLENQQKKPPANTLTNSASPKRRGESECGATTQARPNQAPEKDSASRHVQHDRSGGRHKTIAPAAISPEGDRARVLALMRQSVQARLASK